MSRLVDPRTLRGRWDEARELHYRLLPLMEVNFIESSPGPVKAALAMMGLIEENFRFAAGCQSRRRVAPDCVKS